MVNEEIISCLGERYGTIPADFYSKIEEWKSWWRGKNKAFHEFFEASPNGGSVKRELYRMNMAKKICEDWASLLLNDKTSIKISDPAAEDFVRGVFRDNDFIPNANRLVEKAFATGTGAVILRISSLCDKNGRLAASENSLFSFEFVDASHIIPLSVINGEITEAAFVSECRVRGEEYIYLETHTLEKDGYRIKNDVFVRENGELIRKNNIGCAGEIRTGCPYPFFSIISPNIQNNIDEGCGLGVSVFADAVDCLRGVDLAFNNFCRDIRLGGKKVFIDRSLVGRDEYGNIFTPDDVAQQLFVTLGDGDFSDHPMITEHNPELRSSENAEAVQCQLNYLSFRCGLGTHHYEFASIDGRAKMTAAQYMGERQDMRQNAVKHQKNIAKFIRGAVRSLIWCGKNYFSVALDGECKINVFFDDSYFTDTESSRARDLLEVQNGIMSADEYRNKWFDSL